MGVCGDWLTTPAAADAASMQAAALSGLELAERLVQMVERGKLTGQSGDLGGDLSDLAIGLTEPFVPLGNADIGGFPGQQPEVVAAAAPAAAVGGGRKGGGGSGRGGGRQQAGGQRVQREQAAGARAV